MITAGGVGSHGVGGVIERMCGGVDEVGESVVKVAVDSVDPGDAPPRTIHRVSTGG